MARLLSRLGPMPLLTGSTRLSPMFILHELYSACHAYTLLEWHFHVLILWVKFSIFIGGRHWNFAPHFAECWMPHYFCTSHQVHAALDLSWPSDAHFISNYCVLWKPYFETQSPCGFLWQGSFYKQSISATTCPLIWEWVSHIALPIWRPYFFYSSGV